jgi:hypothetical protein
LTATGLSASEAEYRQRLDEQTDDRIDGWAAELMRDMSIRRGVVRVLHDFRRATGLDDRHLRRVYAVGGGAPAAMGQTSTGEVMVPAISLHHFVTGTRTLLPDARRRLTDYLVDNFHEIVFI